MSCSLKLVYRGCTFLGSVCLLELSAVTQDTSYVIKTWCGSCDYVVRTDRSGSENTGWSCVPKGRKVTDLPDCGLGKWTGLNV